MRWPTHFHWEIAARQALDPGLGISAFLSRLSIVGMLIAVSLLLAALSVMNGFAGELHQRLLSVTPDITLEPTQPSPDGLNELASLSAAQAEVRAVTLYRRGTALLRHGDQSRGIKLVGAPESGLRDVIDLASHVSYGDLGALTREPFSVILGADLARLLRVRPGDEVEILLPRLTVSPLGVFPR